MEVERIERHQGHVFYRISSEYAKDTLAMEPRELMELLTWLSEHENEIIQDALSNIVNHEMKGL